MLGRVNIVKASIFRVENLLCMKDHAGIQKRRIIGERVIWKKDGDGYHVQDHSSPVLIFPKIHLFRNL
jgi:hypothetical protein